MTRPWFYSERGATGTRFVACRPSAGACCVMMATANEGNLNRYDRPIGTRGRLATIKRGWSTMAVAAASSNQGDVIRMHRAMFPGLPDPYLRTTRDGSNVWDAIGTYAVSLSIDAGAVPSSDPIRRYVNGVNHQVACVDKRVKDDKRQVKIMDPMHPPSDSYAGHWVGWGSLLKCAKSATNTGVIVYELYPVGKWTAKALAAADYRKLIRTLRKKLAEAPSDCTEAVKNAKAAGWEAFGNTISADVTKRLNEGPP